MSSALGDSADTSSTSQEQEQPANAAVPVSNTSTCILTSSENVNNENREKELALNSATEPATATPEANHSQDDYSQHITYNALGVAIYTDTLTQAQYEFDNASNDWVAVTATNRIDAVVPSATDVAAAADARTSVDPYENEHYRWCHDTKQWLPKETVVAENEFYTFDAGRNEWIPKARAHTVTSTTSEDGQTLHTYADEDGVVFFWDTTKNAWFPKIDDDFMARYQMGYGNYEASDDDDDEEDKMHKKIADVKAIVPSREMADIEELAADGNTEKVSKKRKGQSQPARMY